MKKKRFSLLAKIILLTGLLTILTVATSLTVSLLVSYNSTKKTYIESCETMTENIEAIFAANEGKDMGDVLNLLVDEYSQVRDNYDNISEEEIDHYQKQTRMSLFGPINDDAFGMTYDKAVRKGYYTESIARMQYLCSSFKVPFSGLFLFDVEKQSIINIAESTNSIDDNFGAIGLKTKRTLTEELEFLTEGSDITTFILNNTAYSINILELNINDANYKCFVEGQYPFAEFNKSFNQQLLT